MMQIFAIIFILPLAGISGWFWFGKSQSAKMRGLAGSLFYMTFYVFVFHFYLKAF